MGLFLNELTHLVLELTNHEYKFESRAQRVGHMHVRNTSSKLYLETSRHN